MSSNYIKIKPDPPTCPHNEGVACDTYTQQSCHRCGWNPNVAKARKEKFCEQNKVTIPITNR